MAQYILSDSFTAIAETSGTVINNSEVAVEINTTGISRTGVTLFPRQHFPFSTSIYAARAPGAIGTAFIGVVPMSMGSGSGSGGGGGTTTIKLDTDTIVVNVNCHCEPRTDTIVVNCNCCGKGKGDDDDGGGFTDKDVKDVFDDDDADADSDSDADADADADADIFEPDDDFYDDDHFDPLDDEGRFTALDLAWVFAGDNFNRVGFTDDDVEDMFED